MSKLATKFDLWVEQKIDSLIIQGKDPFTHQEISGMDIDTAQMFCDIISHLKDLSPTQKKVIIRIKDIHGIF